MPHSPWFPFPCASPLLRLYKPQLTSVRASFDVLIVPFGFYSLSIHTHTHRHVVVVTVCIRHLPFCGQCVLLLLLLLFAYAYLPLNDAAGVVVVAAALYFALPPTLPSTFAFCHCLRLCLYLCLLPLPLPLPSTTAFASTWLHSPFRFRPQFPFPFCTRAHLFAFWWSCCSRCNIGNGPGPETNGTLSLSVCLSLTLTNNVGTTRAGRMSLCVCGLCVCNAPPAVWEAQHLSPFIYTIRNRFYAFRQYFKYSREEIQYIYTDRQTCVQLYIWIHMYVCCMCVCVGINMWLYVWSSLKWFMSSLSGKGVAKSIPVWVHHTHHPHSPQHTHANIHTHVVQKQINKYAC